jgi:hypothetical protein
MGIYGSSGRTHNPLAVLALGVGAIGATCSLILWVYQANPDGDLIRTISDRLGSGALLGDRMTVIALVCGGIAVALAIVGSLGGRMGGSGVVAVLLGAIALSFPILSSVDVISRPLSRGFP